MLLNYFVCYLTGAHMIKSTHRHYFFLLFKTVEFSFSPCSSVAVKLDGRRVQAQIGETSALFEQEASSPWVFAVRVVYTKYS